LILFSILKGFQNYKLRPRRHLEKRQDKDTKTRTRKREKKKKKEKVILIPYVD
jgi:hypothetical protein